ncbi:MAG: dihydroorotate dehydrogenase-like protein [Bacteroidales bacterium]|nr:dihydroorotate dehydrogenase-like protein [Bacteroidales bacterium]
MDTSTKYMGLNVKSPIVAGSCGLTNSVADLEKLQEAGAGAVVLKSIFEEQIIFDIKKNASQMAPVENYGESYEYIAAHVAADSMSHFFNLVRDARKILSIPIVGSINCYSFENWLNYAKRFQDAGCDAMELNMAVLPYDPATSTEDVERLFTDVITTLKKVITVPISIKVGPNFTDMAKFMQQLSWMGINNITLFNKSMNIDIDVDSMELKQASILSEPNDIFYTLRWVAILSKCVRCELSASTGVFTSNDVVKMLLAGAQTVQVVTALYQNGLEYIRTLNEGLKKWMADKGFAKIEDFRGMLAVKPNDDASMFLRTEFMKYFAKIV